MLFIIFARHFRYSLPINAQVAMQASAHRTASAMYTASAFP